jgi:caa(3)-type oxidase subunit IV
MTTTEHAAPTDTSGHDGPAAHGGHETSDLRYVQIAIFLAVLTGLEVTLTYVHIGKLFLPVLLMLMIIKFLTVVLEFMHLRSDDKMFNMLFWSGLILAIGVYCGALATFKFFLA